MGEDRFVHLSVSGTIENSDLDRYVAASTRMAHSA